MEKMRKSRMKKNRSFKFLVMMIGILMFVMSCGGNVRKNASKDEIVAANFRDIRDLNPHNYAGELYAQNILYEGLVSINKDGSIAPQLAEKWEISKDGKEYTFHLRKNVVFSDGEKFDAKAVKANFDAIMENKDRHGWLESVRLFNGFETPDDYTFKIKLKEPYYPMLIELGSIRPFRFISPKAMKNGKSTKNGVDKYIGTGPYVLKSNKTDEEAIFEVNEKYWGKKPAIKTIRVKVIPEEQTRALALEKGDIDIVFGRDMIDSESFKKFKEKKGFSAIMSEPVATRMMLVNTTKGALKDKNVRKALQHVLNKKEISEGIFEGTETPADSILAKTVPYANIDVPVYDYSLDEAKKLLDAAGWVQGADGKRQKDGKPLVITLNYNADSVSEKAISEYFGQQLAKIGVELKTVGEEEQSYRDRMKKGDFGIVFNISWGIPYDPQSFLGGMRKPVYGDFAAQQGLPEKSKIDESILKGLKTTSESERAELFKYVLTTLQDEAVYIPVTYETNRAIFNDRVKNVKFGTSLYEVPYYSMNLK